MKTKSRNLQVGEAIPGQRHDERDFVQSKFFTRRISVGGSSKIYVVTNDLVAKVCPYYYDLGYKDADQKTIELFEREYRISRDLHQEGISVPRPVGIHKVKIRWFDTAFGLSYPEMMGYVMERIFGINGWKTEGDLRKRVRELHKLELAKSKEKGFKPGDADINNTVYDPKQDRIYLVDCSHWHRS